MTEFRSGHLARFLLVPALTLSIGLQPLQAKEKIKVVEDGQLIAKLCVDYLTNGQDNFNQLTDKAYSIKKKKRSWIYRKGVQVILFGAKGVDVSRSPRDRRSFCTFRIRGISQRQANQVFETLQKEFVSAGYKAGANKAGFFRFRETVYEKADVRFEYDGNYQSPAAWFSIVRK